jgi:hypothetical protein
MELTDKIVGTGGIGEPDGHVPRDDGAQVEVPPGTWSRSSTSGGKSSHEVANYIQRLAVSYECTNFTWKVKYKALAVSRPNIDNKKVMGCLLST